MHHSDFQVANLVGDPILFLDADLSVAHFNDAAAEVFGWVRETLIGSSAVELVHPDDLTAAFVGLKSLSAPVTDGAEAHDDEASASSDSPGIMELRIRQSDGDFRLTEALGRHGAGPSGEPLLCVTLRDLTSRHRWQAVDDNGETTRQVLEYAPMIMLVLQADGTVTGASAGLARQLGYDTSKIVGQPLSSLVPPDAHPELQRHLSICRGRSSGVHVFETRIQHAGHSADEVSTYQLRVVNLLDDLAVQGMVATAFDISEIAGVRQRLTHLATHDDLTGLPNRALVHDRLSRMLANRARRVEDELAVMYLDLDNFRPINHTHGHAIGDKVLMATAARLQTAVRDSDTVARLGGDEFVVMCEHIGEKDLHPLIARLRRVVAQPIDLGDVVLEVSTTVGVARAFPGADSSALLDIAARAMDAAKSDAQAASSASIS